MHHRTHIRSPFHFPLCVPILIRLSAKSPHFDIKLFLCYNLMTYFCTAFKDWMALNITSQSAITHTLHL